MKWFRSNLSNGSRLALFALATQLVLSFGHFHPAAAKGAAVVRSDTAQLDLAFVTSMAAQDPAAVSAGQPEPADDQSQRSTEPCAICAVMALANAALFATPPILLLPQAIDFLYRVTDAEFVHLDSARVVFQPRAPPAS